MFVRIIFSFFLLFSPLLSRVAKVNAIASDLEFKNGHIKYIAAGYSNGNIYEGEWEGKHFTNGSVTIPEKGMYIYKSNKQDIEMIEIR